ncbi:MAG TPA: carboxymuconolactone decarboxylase family protein, partial [Rugosimonospora sp.]|nr:carboxymuconolactone decarboxylase family protein [Rugosimonospora sp.]
MPHIALPGDLPGIRGLMASKPSTGARLAQLAEELLRGASPLSPVERETIAVHVSRLNECEFCARSHAAAARHLDPAAPEPAARLDALLDLAGAVARGG